MLDELPNPRTIGSATNRRLKGLSREIGFAVALTLAAVISMVVASRPQPDKTASMSSETGAKPATSRPGPSVQ